MLSVIVADASLELVPVQLAGHPIIRRVSKARGKKPREILFDISYLLPLKKEILEDQEKRGRPDVVHRALLSILDSPLKQLIKMRVFLHTYEGRIFEVKRETRLPRNYQRFIGLMEQLLLRGEVGPRGAPLIRELRLNLPSLIEELSPKSVVALSERGRIEDPILFSKRLLKGDHVLIVGGFPHGEYSEEVKAVIEQEFSLCEEVLPASTAICMLLSYLYYAIRWFG